MSSENLKPLFVVGGVGILAYLIFGRSSDAKAATPAVAPTPGTVTPPGGTPTGGGPKPTDIDPVTGLRFRIVDASTTTPGDFATKYAGSFNKWKEIASVNDNLYLVDVVGSCRKTAENPDGVGSCYTTKEKRADGQPVYVYPYQTIAPWQLGMPVLLPPSWKG
jgi:hypothetical protein